MFQNGLLYHQPNSPPPLHKTQGGLLYYCQMIVGMYMYNTCVHTCKYVHYIIIPYNPPHPLKLLSQIPQNQQPTTNKQQPATNSSLPFHHEFPKKITPKL